MLKQVAERIDQIAGRLNDEQKDDIDGGEHEHGGEKYERNQTVDATSSSTQLKPQKSLIPKQCESIFELATSRCDLIEFVRRTLQCLAKKRLHKQIVRKYNGATCVVVLEQKQLNVNDFDERFAQHRSYRIVQKRRTRQSLFPSYPIGHHYPTKVNQDVKVKNEKKLTQKFWFIRPRACAGKSKKRDLMITECIFLNNNINNIQSECLCQV